MHEIALISDIHFGCRSNSEKYLAISEDFFKTTLFDLVKDRGITDVRILGDLFDNRNTVNIRTLNVVLSVFRTFNAQLPDVRFKILLGNHDIYYHNRVDINSIEALRELPNVDVIDKVEREVIDGKTLITVPWVASKEGSIAETFYDYVTGDEKIDILMGHFEIQGFEMSPGIRDDHGLTHGIFTNFERVITGHYHIRNTVGRITYMGCPYQLTWGDYGDQKGIHILHVGDNDLEFVPNMDSPIHYKVKISELATDKKKEILENIDCNFVKLLIDKKCKDSTIIKVINKIESLYPLRLDVENQFVDNIDFECDVEADLSEMTDPLSFLVEYAKVIELNDDYEQNELIDRLSTLYQQTLREND